MEQRRRRVAGGVPSTEIRSHGVPLEHQPSLAASGSRRTRVRRGPARPHSRSHRPRGRGRHDSRRRDRHRAAWQDCNARRLWLPRQGGRHADVGRCGVLDRLDDQADGLGRHHDAGRGRTPAARRSRFEVPAPARRHESREVADERRARNGAGRARDDRAGSAAAYLRSHLPEPRHQRRLPRLSRARHQRDARQGRVPDAARQGAAAVPAGHGVGVRRLDRHPRLHHRGGVRQAPRRFPVRAPVATARHGRHRLRADRPDAGALRARAAERSADRRAAGRLPCDRQDVEVAIGRRRLRLDGGGLSPLHANAARRRRQRRPAPARAQDHCTDDVRPSRHQYRQPPRDDHGPGVHRIRLRARLRGAQGAGPLGRQRHARRLLLVRRLRHLLLERSGRADDGRRDDRRARR